MLGNKVNAITGIHRSAASSSASNFIHGLHSNNVAMETGKALRQVILPRFSILDPNTLSPEDQIKYLSRVPKDSVAAFIMGYSQHSTGEGVKDYVKNLKNFYTNFKPNSSFAFALFPTENNSAFPAYSAVTAQTKETFRQNRYARWSQRRLTDLALANFGLRCAGKYIVERKDIKTNPPAWLKPNNIASRMLLQQIIESLSLLGNRKLAGNLAATAARLTRDFALPEVKTFERMRNDIWATRTTAVRPTTPKLKSAVVKPRSIIQPITQ